MLTRRVTTMVMMQVTVPDGVGPGDAMSIQVGEQEFTITVPDGVGPGDPLDVDLPVDEGAGGGVLSCSRSVS